MAARGVVEDLGKVRQEENFFLALFEQVVEGINYEDVPEEAISESIEKFVDFFRENRKPAGVCAANNFSTLADLLGYFYWNSPISAAVTRNKTLAALENCPEFRSCFHQETVKMVSVGGGTGSDLVGLYSAVYGNSHFESLEILLMDNYKNWKAFFKKINELLLQDKFGNASKLIKSERITASFVRADMPIKQWDNMTSRCSTALRIADLVWMKGFLSVLDNDYGRKTVTEKIISSMRPGALLVVMESLAYDQFDVFVDDNKLKRLFNTDQGGYQLLLHSEPHYYISRNTTQEIIIFERI